MTVLAHEGKWNGEVPAIWSNSVQPTALIETRDGNTRVTLLADYGAIAAHFSIHTAKLGEFLAALHTAFDHTRSDRSLVVIFSTVELASKGTGNPPVPPGPGPGGYPPELFPVPLSFGNTAAHFSALGLVNQTNDAIRLGATTVGALTKQL